MGHTGSKLVVPEYTGITSAEQTNPHTHSARFQATEIRMSVKTRLVTDSSEVSATSGKPETVGRSYIQHLLVVRRCLAEKGSAHSTHTESTNQIC